MPDEDGSKPRGPLGRARAERALGFGEYLRGRFALMEGLIEDLEATGTPEDRAQAAREFRRAIRKAQRVRVAHIAVTVLLAMSVVTTVAAFLFDLLYIPPALEARADATVVLLDRLTALAGSLSLVLLGARLALDRYLQLVEIKATFLAIRVATVRDP